MSSTVETNAHDVGASDKVKLAIAIVLVLAGIAGYYVLSAQPAWERWAAVAAGIVLGGLVVAFSRFGTEFNRFVADSRVEIRKIVWPTRQETGKMTLVVFVFLIVAGLFFWALDFALAWATRALTGQGG